MKNFVLLVSLTILLLAFASLTLASTASAQQATPIAQQGATPSPTVSAEVIALRAQTEILREDNERMFSAVAMGLGAIVAIALIQWAQNRWSYDRDKKAIQEELMVFVRAEIERAMQDVVTQMQAKMRSEADNLRVDLSILEYDILKQQAANWESNEVYINALRGWIDILQLGYKVGNQYWIEDALDEIQRLLKLEDIELQANVSRELHEILKKLPSEYGVEVDTVLAQARMVRQKDTTHSNVRTIRRQKPS